SSASGMKRPESVTSRVLLHRGELQRERLPFLHEPRDALLRLLARLGNLTSAAVVAIELRIREGEARVLETRLEVVNLRFDRAQAGLDRLDLATDLLALAPVTARRRRARAEPRGSRRRGGGRRRG